MNTVIQKIENILTSTYDIQNYLELCQEIFAALKIVTPNVFHKEYSNFSSHIEGYSHIGNYHTPDGKEMAIFSVKLQQNSFVEHSRSKQRNFAKKLIENGNCDAALVAFYTEGDPTWRLSFVRLDYEMKIENGRLKTAENLTPAKRYSYLVGKDEPCHTAIDRFRQFIIDDHSQPTLDEFEDAFSVEKVTKEFFGLYCEKFQQLREHLASNEDFVAEAMQHNFTAAQFAKKLMGQIIFLYFLQKKGWLGVGVWPLNLTEKEYNNVFYISGAQGRIIKQYLPQIYTKQENGTYGRIPNSLEAIPDDAEEVIANHMVRIQNWGDGSQKFLRTLFEYSKSHMGNFFDNYLEPLFYDTLNRNRGDMGYCRALHCRIPFLSGGLFDPLDGYDWKSNNFNIPDGVFSNRQSENDRDGDGILDIFDRYNFTMSEDEPMEREVAIDPEMLGKIFENLLEVNDRKSKGAFYTPREIVHYMCQESLINYLVQETKISEFAIRDFILYGDLMKDEDTTKEKRKGNGGMYISDEIYKVSPDGSLAVNRLTDIDNALATVCIADPAVGSGAFPLGMLNEIVRARENISAYMAITMNANDIRMMYQLDRSPYQLKVHTIKNSIFAVDIEPSAVDIAQLRLWLSLVIDDEINPYAQNDLEGHRNPLPLPNLECNILCGNSLVDEFEGVPLINASELIATTYENQQQNFYQGSFDSILPRLLQAQDELFYCKETHRKEELKEEISSLRDMIIMSQIKSRLAPQQLEEYQQTKSMISKPFILWQLDFARVFREKGGFDIIIGNPPYIGFHKVPNKEYNKTHYSTANGKYDFYVLFIERALQLTSKFGFISYICPSYFYKRDYGKSTRELFLRNTSIKFIADFSDYQIFESALTYTCIFGASKAIVPNNKISVLNESLSIQDAHFILQSALKEPTWILEKADTNAILKKVQSVSAHTFGDITKSISQGIVTGNNNVFLIDQSVIDAKGLEDIYLKTAYKGKDISNGEVHDGGYKVFYPYYIDDRGKTVCISEETLSTEAPNLYTYLHSHKKELLSRTYFINSSKAWYELWNPRKMEHFYHRKFVFSEIGLVNDFVLVDECFYTDSACGAELLDEYLKYESFIYKYLNSKLATYIYKKISVPKANGYSIYKNAFLKNMPIVLPLNSIDYMSMDDSEFNKILYSMIGLTGEEVTMVETAQYS